MHQEQLYSVSELEFSVWELMAAAGRQLRQPGHAHADEVDLYLAACKASQQSAAGKVKVTGSRDSKLAEARRLLTAAGPTGVSGRVGRKERRAG